MKITKYLVLGLLAFGFTPVFSQNNSGVIIFDNNQQVATTNLTKFNLDFPGGPPYLLIAAIEKATGKPLNVIIPEENVNTGLPALKMNNVNVAQLFTALEAASKKRENHMTSLGGSYGFDTGYGFKTDNNSWLSDDSIWYFYVLNPPQDPQHSDKICRYYQLAPYLNSGLSVDDITTAIQTGWKMLGDNSPPEINFHKETKLLIAVGGEYQLKVIDDVLKALQPTAQDPQLSFNQRLSAIISASGQPSPPPRRPLPIVLQTNKPPLSPEAQAAWIEQQRQNSLVPLPPTQNPSPVAPTDTGK